MGIESEADLALFLDPADFGVAAVYRRKATVTDIAINGIFDAEHQLLGLSNDVDVSSVQPKLLVRASDLPAGAGDGDTVTIGAVPYSVRHSEPDGTGMTTLRLEKN
jgi:hypothetical protein